MSHAATQFRVQHLVQSFFCLGAGYSQLEKILTEDLEPTVRNYKQLVLLLTGYPVCPYYRHCVAMVCSEGNIGAGMSSWE